MRQTEESKAAPRGNPLDDHGIDATATSVAFSSTALREPTLAAVKRRSSIAGSPFPSTAHRQPILSLLASKSAR